MKKQEHRCVFHTLSKYGQIISSNVMLAQNLEEAKREVRVDTAVYNKMRWAVSIASEEFEHITTMFAPSLRHWKYRKRIGWTIVWKHRQAIERLGVRVKIV